ncbi:hypothetical protein HMPREF1214_01812 [Bacteroides sp. HPS0048]|uniref:hypothetical protein n=1 Tax=Bacteroides sp. HPS0048 TaxID=1078089 RepID=UPI00036A06DB|nr:hypothetical protein [Bacteroides sp. HPS0048]EOA58977.1 hypothetical protein HMPREF1214_01812 [Bacteroides sp. HPS0048]
MTILQQPDALSLSGNIKDFRISTPGKISFVLLQGATEILSQNYDPGQDGLVTISLKDIIHSCLSFQLQESSQVYLQPTLADTFTARFSDEYVVNPDISGDPVYTDITFRAVRAGIDRFADTATNFLTQNFLTWQPTVKPVTYYSPEFLTYYAVVPCIVKLRAYFTDDSGSVITQKDITLSDFEAGKAYTIPLQYASVAGKLDNELPGYYDVWIENTEGVRLTYIQRYYASDMLSEQEQWILFENSLGGIDTFRAYGSSDFTGEHTHNIAEIEDNSLEYRVDTERKFQKNTGHLNAQERRWLLDFFPSLSKYIYTGSYLRPIVVTESNVTYTDRELPSNYTFTYKYADARPFLNIPRTEPAGDLNITVPGVGSFTVPPRLVEFPRLPLTEGALFPVQDPYSEKWYTATSGSLSDFIANRLSKNYDGNGGIGHQHDNFDLLQLLTYTAEYLLVAGKKIKAGYAEESYTFCDNMSQELITFLKGLVSEGLITAGNGIQFGKSFASGLTGHGGSITSAGHGELRSLRVNEWFETSEFRYNYVDVTTGEKWSAPGGGIIESVIMDTDPEGNELNTGVVTLKLEAGQIGAVAFDDLAMGMYHYESGNATEDYDDGKGNRRFAGFTTVFFRITEIIGTGLNSKFRFELRNASDNYPNPVSPTAMMHFVCFGNVSNKSRQSSMYQTRTYTRYLKNVDWWEYSFSNIAMQFGDLSNLSVFGADMTGYSAYVDSLYFTGKIEQLKKIVEDTLGTGDLRMEIDSSGGYFVIDNKIDTTLTAKVLRYFKNVTGEATRWEWTRESGTDLVDIASDAIWNENHSSARESVHITEDDVRTDSVKFICEATVGVAKVREEVTF